MFQVDLRQNNKKEKKDLLKTFYSGKSLNSVKTVIMKMETMEKIERLDLLKTLNSVKKVIMKMETTEKVDLLKTFY